MKNRHMVSFGIAALFAFGCGGQSPTVPSGRPSSSGEAPPLASGESFGVTGTVTDDRGAPIVAADVVIAHWLGGRLERPVARTDASGRYALNFTANPWTNANGRFAARAEVMLEGYEWHWQSLPAASQIVQDVRLSPLKRISAGDSIELSLTTENGECIGWLYGPCSRVRVVVPFDGRLTIDAVASATSAALPAIEACCVGGNETGGNPVTLVAEAGKEISVEIGQSGPAVVVSPQVLVRTSIH